MSSPLPISYVEHGASVTPGASGILGSSPRTQQVPATAARKFYKRLLYDATVDASQFSVGMLETREQAERKSGAEAWSLRLHSSLIELSFNDFMARFDVDDIPFHRIAFFKQNGVIVWEAENLLRKTGDPGHHSCHNSSSTHHHSHSRSDLPPAPMLSSSFTGGCSPPAGGFMARLAAATTPAAATGLPPRVSSSQVPDYSSSSSFTAPSSSGKPQRHSATDYSSSPRSWGGTTSHWSAAAALMAELSGGPGCTGNTPLGTSPLGSGYCSHSSATYGTSPKLAGSWTGNCCATAGILGSNSRGGSFTVSPSPGGSCSSSWTGTSPLAAALAAGAASLPHPRTASVAGASNGAHLPLPPSMKGAVELSVAGCAPCPANDKHLQEQLLLLQQQLQDFEEPALADYSLLPEECWVLILQQLGVKELCIMSRINRSLRALAARSCLWSTAYERLFGTTPPADWSGQTVKRLCRRSELRASRWIEADVEGRPAGFSGTWCCQLDDSKVVSGDGCAVRLWSHDTGRRIATLRGHSGRVTSVAFDDELIISGCSQGAVKLWHMDELKLWKTLRHHTGPVSSTVLLHGLPISSSKDGSICVWDAAAPNTPMVVLEVGSPVQALELQEDKGHLLCASNNLGVYDMNTTQLLFNLQAPAVPYRLSSSSNSSSSSSSPRYSGTAAAAGPNAAVAAVAEDGEDEDADAADGVLLQEVWLDEDLSGGSDADDIGGAADGNAAVQAAGVLGPAPSDAKPFTSVSCYSNLVAAGRAGGVVLWDLRSQDAVGLISPSGPPCSSSSSSAAASGALRSPNAPCIGVQLDDWKVVTGWAGAIGSADTGGGSCWWRGGTDVAGSAEGWGSVGHSLEVYDIRAAASFSSCNLTTTTSSSSSGSSKGLWGPGPVMSLPVPNRITCFQFHKENLLVGQEGADCCLISFNPPGSSTTRAAAAWGFSCGSSSSRAAAGGHQGCYGTSPGGGFEDAGVFSEGGVGRGGGSNKGKKKGAAKVPAKKQTRYPKRATR